MGIQKIYTIYRCALVASAPGSRGVQTQSTGAPLCVAGQTTGMLRYAVTCIACE
jgi:hypothetical protein